MRTCAHAYMHACVHRSYFEGWLDKGAQLTNRESRIGLVKPGLLVLFDFGAVGTRTCPKQTPNKIFCIMKGIRILRDNYCPCAPFNIFDHHLNLNLRR